MVRVPTAMALILCISLVPSARVATAQAKTPPADPTAPQAPAPLELPTLVFVLPANLDAETRAAVHDAIGTQLALVPARPVLLDAPASAAPPLLEERVAAGVALAREHRAIGVLWLDVRPTDHWFVYAMDAHANHVVVRPLFVQRESVAAAVETLSMIARASAEALVRGDPVRGETVVIAPPAPPPPSAAHAPRPRSPARRPAAASAYQLRLSLGYHGETFSEDQPWQSGAQLSAELLWTAGPYAALGFTFFPEHTFGDRIRFSVQRRPLSLLGGFRFVLAPHLALDTELAATLDPRSRRTTDTPAGVAARSDQHRVVVSVSPRARIEALPSAWLGIYVTVGLDILFNEFDYLTTPDQADPELRPYRARPGAMAGVAFYH